MRADVKTARAAAAAGAGGAASVDVASSEARATHLDAAAACKASVLKHGRGLRPLLPPAGAANVLLLLLCRLLCGLRIIAVLCVCKAARL